MSRRVVVEVNADLHRELRKLAAAYDSKLFVIANALLEDILSDEPRVKAVLERLEK